jgi:RNA polymerase sigma-70 factor (ECF subfamily)
MSQPNDADGMATPGPHRDPTEPGDRPDAESTEVLLCRARTGDRSALDVLFDRCLPPLRRWASGRLPRYVRDIADTQDLVQETVLGALRRLNDFEPRRDGAIHAYLRQAVLNRIRDEFRRARRRPEATPLDHTHHVADASPLELAIGSQTLARYEAALARLRPDEREAVIARVELGCSYDEIASALGKPSRDAARMAVTRAIVKLAIEMDVDRG